MRLVCPSCDAEYEIARSAIPRSGREVECSNCGLSWFQAFSDLRLNEAVHDSDRDTDQAIPPHVVDDAVLEVLRQETAREVMARQAEAGGFGLDTAHAGQAQTPWDLQTQGADYAQAQHAAGDLPAPPPRPRRDLLPAIDDISATWGADLDTGASSQAAQDLPQITPTPLGRAVLFLALVGVILLALYVFAPEIAAKVPALSKVSGDYVAAVDRAVLWAQDHLRQAVTWLQSLGRR